MNSLTSYQAHYTARILSFYMKLKRTTIIREFEKKKTRIVTQKTHIVYNFCATCFGLVWAIVKEQVITNISVSVYINKQFNYTLIKKFKDLHL